ncbi:hypothetical protein M0D69_03270 [Caballeronia sp. SEWSISQ10-4 2]|uniref:hypothetical protein n=1 Tax=Caballeronia sp. SEWSISQ10-4 2 TaxID=2937438 RepID=UPI00264ECEB2|nr:hypothetical protein [Caballeronia sp. SEWSISQ10-4 2]MDN7177051.1 hypothetical protein [Caballeronia sp. SEWSISQ10-4 2]
MPKIRLACATLLATCAIPVCVVAQDAPRPPGIDPYTETWVQVTGKYCWLYIYDAMGGSKAEWTGACKDGFVTGPGTATIHSGYSGTKVIFGNFTKGLFNGHAVVDVILDGVHTRLEVDDAESGRTGGQGTINRDSAGQKIFEYTGQIRGTYPQGQGHGVLYDPQSGAVVADYTGQWIGGKPADAKPK